MSAFASRHINNVIDVAALGTSAVVLGTAYLVWGYEGWTALFGYLIVRVLLVGWNADKNFNNYLDARYGRRVR